MKKFFKKILHKNTRFYKFSSYPYNWYKMHWQPLKHEDLNKLLTIYTTLKDNVYFIQEVSNDGISNDPLLRLINKFKWIGICIEPIPVNFQKLQKIIQTLLA